MESSCPPVSPSTPVNWESLDALVADFAASENLIEPASPSQSSSSPSSTSYGSRTINRQIRRSLENGEIDRVIELLKAHAPCILEDHRILFRLEKQKFIELLRKGTEEDRDAAIECLRKCLAPCALDAYPEAYEEFKHILLAFIYDKDDQSSPVADEWSEKKRFEIAGLMSSVLRAHLHAYDPFFAMTLRYLISIHKEYCFRQGMPSPISDLTERLLFKERDPPATVEDILYEAPPFDEVDIQALLHAVELSRQGAVDSLRFAKGDLHLAFQNELCRMRLNVPMLDDLVHEYCIYRGIVECDMASPFGSQMHVDSDLVRVEKPEDGASEISDELTTVQGMDTEVRYADETTSSHEICSTSESPRSTCSRALRRSRNYGTGERSKRKRWRGRQEYLISMDDLSESHLSNARLSDDKYNFILEMKELTSRGMAMEVFEEINNMDPDFFKQNPLLQFQLKQVEFLNLVSSGDNANALRIACSHLGPLAAKDPELLKPLKETLMALLRPEEGSLGKCFSLDNLATSLQVAIGRRLGIEEPRLMKIMRATLHSHNEWFKLQMCRDRFEGLLRIDFLKDVNRAGVAAMSKSNADSCTHGSSVMTTSSSARMADDGSSPAQVSSSEGVCDESAILKVMEFLALPRADAIHLLSQYNGNAETVIQQLFA
ncbi:hypothetical protein MLD38_031458 [Melastoma candidum]|uniref:Uncharacterized protein n=1 Tax=Melastoma candidum TaxID=119954 RepID=A0ACB9MPR9_9MYRT|nr:hypothetical protein MLD38_031458 [Melastoma candidum]